MFFRLDFICSDTCGNDWVSKAEYLEAPSLEKVWEMLGKPVVFGYVEGGKSYYWKRMPKTWRSDGMWDDNPDFDWQRDKGYADCFRCFGLLVSGLKVRDNVEDLKGNELLLGPNAKKDEPLPFNFLSDQEKWKMWDGQTGQWACRHCGAVLTDGPHRAAPFHGASVCCGECDGELTRRTGGGQGDPFGWVLVQKEEQA